jgi:hypothetical protein
MKRLSVAVSAVLTALLYSLAAPPQVALAQTPIPSQVGVAGQPPALFVSQDSGRFTFYDGQLTAAPAIVSIPVLGRSNPGAPLYIGTGLDHALWVRSQTQGWQHLSAQYTYCLDNPAAVLELGQNGPFLTVACQGLDHALWYSQMQPVFAGSLPVMGAFQSLGGILISGPAATVGTNGLVTFFVNGIHSVWARQLSPGVQTNWEETPWICKGHPAAGDATPLKFVFLVAVFACHGQDDSVWIALLTSYAGPWSSAFSIGGAVVDGVAVAVRPDGATVYAQGLDSHVYANRINYVPPIVGGWNSIGGTARFGTGAAALLPAMNQP